ncbi:hypothetical protein AGRA3207_007855 (plasmid) [Actinomadura graeca]|uniref:Uncharacterized protein n=1 Tax=Actinomadura graeca TaxID=2750812 RepID=A0ABX8R874_9ACTN|nr:STAS domain-containing protein [Actinomadura graeca]QXJ27058.1 hypothetical protein AGRA3207_007855 [Actinomadura graeca]
MRPGVPWPCTGTMALAAPRPAVQRALDTAGFPGSFQVFATVEAAATPAPP